MQKTDAALIEGLKRGIESGEYTVFDPNADGGPAGPDSDPDQGPDPVDRVHEAIAALDEIGAAERNSEWAYRVPTEQEAHNQWHQANDGSGATCPLDCDTSLPDPDDYIDLDTVDTDPAEPPRPAGPVHGRNIDPDQRPATQKQIDFITKLSQERDVSQGHGLRLITVARAMWTDGILNTKAASTLIDDLLALPHPISEEALAGLGTEPPEGMHKVGDTIYKVQRALYGSGNLYAKALVESPSTESGWTFTYAKGAIRKLSEATALSLEEARAFGSTYGVCCVCGRTLTDEDSIANGIGPVCGSKF